MGWLSLQVAKLFGQKLPAFKSQAEAEEHLFAERDARVSRLAALAGQSGGVFTADFSPASLKGLELWYFALWESDGFSSLGLSREEFERCMAMYFCEAAVRNCPRAKWIVQEYAFEPGKYELGVQRGHVSLMRSRFTDHYQQPRNKRRQRIYREYQEHFGD
jgi:hypothetical protein